MKTSHDFSSGVSVSLKTDSFSYDLAREQADLTFAASGTDQTGQRSRFRKTGFLQDGFPLCSLEQGLLRSQIAIGKSPPATGEAENRFRPELGRRRVHEDEAASGSQQAMQIAQSSAHIFDRVQHIGADNEVERSRFQFLIGSGFFEIENLKFHFWKRRQLLRGGGKESGRDVAEDVGMQATLEQRQNLRS